MSVIIRLQNLPPTAFASDVRQLFNGLKIPDGAVHIVGGPEGDVFVGFASDEDARQAMRRDRQMIHNQEIRLLLSSKTEMTGVIEQAKMGYFSPKDQEAEPSPTWQQQQQQPTQNYGANRSNNGGYNATYAVKERDNTNEYNSNQPQQFQRNSGNQQQNDSKPDYGYHGSFQDTKPQVTRFTSPQNVNKFQNMAEKPANGGIQQVTQPYTRPPPVVAPMMQPKIEQKSPPQIMGMNMAVPPPMHTNVPPTAAVVNTPRVVSASSDSWRGDFTQPPPSTDFTIPTMNVPPPIAPRNGPLADAFTQRKTLLGNNGVNGAQRIAPIIPGVRPAMIPTPSLNDLKFFIEMSRLPNDLLRPAAIEEFIRPSVPLSLSSVKVVFGPGGVHVNTLVRLENQQDFARTLERDGEMGIRIRTATKKDFDEAMDGVPVAPIVTAPTRSPPRRERPKSPLRRRSRSRSPLRRRRPEQNERKSRWGERSMSPIRRRRRSNSPLMSRQKRNEHADPTRWCIQLTNVPFRMKDEELMEWFAEKVRPARLTRTFYADGNASDRWIAEFSSETLMDRAFSIKKQCQNRFLRMSYIDNKTADEILKIEDVYGKEKKMINEEKRDQMDNAAPPSFFNAPPPMAKGAPPGGFIPAQQQQPPMNGQFNGQQQQRGGYNGRGGGFGQQRGRGGYGGGFGGNGEQFQQRGGGYRGRGRGGNWNYQQQQYQGYNGGNNEMVDMVNSLGPQAGFLPKLSTGSEFGENAQR